MDRAGRHAIHQDVNAVMKPKKLSDCQQMRFEIPGIKLGLKIVLDDA